MKSKALSLEINKKTLESTVARHCAQCWYLNYLSCLSLNLKRTYEGDSGMWDTYTRRLHFSSQAPLWKKRHVRARANRRALPCSSFFRSKINWFIGPSLKSLRALRSSQATDRHTSTANSSARPAWEVLIKPWQPELALSSETTTWIKGWRLGNPPVNSCLTISPARKSKEEFGLI